MSYIKPKNPGTYKSAYAGQLTKARNELMNYKYDPLKDANYQAFASIYGARGNQAAQDTLGEAAALNGGFGTSYAVSAAEQARNQYNQELAALVPELEQNAYDRMLGNYNLLMDADNDAYQKYRDAIADYQWGKNYDTDVYSLKKSSAGGGGGGRRKSSGGGGYSSGSSGSSGSGMPITKADFDSLKNGKVLNQGNSVGNYYSTGTKKPGGGSSQVGLNTKKKKLQ